MIPDRRFTDGHIGKRYFKLEVWIPIILTVVGMTAAIVWAGGGVAQNVKTNTQRVLELRENNQQLKEKTARIDERTQQIKEQQTEIRADIKAILKELRR